MEAQDKVNKIAILLIVVSALAGCLYGLDIGVIAGSLGFIDKEMSLTPGQQGMIVGAVLGGGAFATLISGFIADIFGRKKILILSTIFFIVGILFAKHSVTYAHLLAGRLIMGVGVGISSMVVPVYLSEAAPARIRGRAISCFQLFLTAGILLAYLVDLMYTKSGDWRSMFFALIYPTVVLLIGSLLIPESPTWLFMKGKKEECKKVLNKIHSKIVSENIYIDMEALAGDSLGTSKANVIKKAYIVPFLLAFGIACLTQLTGINCVLQYAPTIFSEAGANSHALAMVLGTGVTVINLVITIIATFLIDRLGRKPLLLFSTGGVTLSLLLMGVASFLPVSTLRIVLLAVGMFSFIATYAIGIGVIVWIAMSELLPTAIRAKGLAISLFANSAISTIIASVFVVVKTKIGYGNIFFILAGFTLVYFLITLFFVPETKGKTIEEIEEHFRSN